MKRALTLLLTLAMFVSLFAVGGIQAFAAKDVEMQYMTADETEAVLGTDGYTVVDLRKVADFEEAHIPGAVSVDMSAAVEGDAAAGEAAVKAAFEGVDDTLILVCYSGKKYAQAGTNALAAVGYDMSKVFTLKDGFNGWKETKAELTESGAAAAEVPETTLVRWNYGTSGNILVTVALEKISMNTALTLRSSRPHRTPAPCSCSPPARWTSSPTPAPATRCSRSLPVWT